MKISRSFLSNQEDSESKRRSLFISVLCSLLLLLAIVFFKINWRQVDEPQYIAVNFGNTDLGDGPAEPMETASAAAAASSSSASTPTEAEEPLITDQSSDAPISAPKVKKKINSVKPNNSKPKINNKPSKNQTNSQEGTSEQNNQSTSDGKGREALGNLLGGKGSSPSTGQGSGGSGNQGDPTGQNSFGNGGRKLTSKIPEPQFHDCPESGIIKVEYVLDKKGNVKSARIAKGSTSNDPCLQDKAIALVKKYVRGNEGVDNDRAIYTVKLD